MPPNRLAQIVELVRNRLIDRVARVLNVFAQLVADFVEGNRVPHFLASMLRPFRAAQPGAACRGRGHAAGLARERPWCALAARAQPKEQRESRSCDESECGCRQQVVFVALTPARRIPAV